ncbi:MULTISPECIES: hypothetical protein [unclassified Tenacibaculum]|uniref:hypothetical protein n=1 Tax=unclassified Tenacibaculum TaxID=2635139 RepID=UPI001F18B17A|nr:MULTISPECIES: hypothetical protein [unclassified Tenacibaculum]MCF2875012.1 hypothetical protein [Tenacibaculum sp. Cn5-1]MCF2935088.1 hypothetical protein [Tenacibaculum sp. Cn5-34]MCG7511470.1 hypothetical protein [Tenacibaculum sp. Cn5-46]
MHKTKIILLLIFLSWTTSSSGQGFNKTYQGLWASTIWTFEFELDGNYKRISSGHYGNTTVKGTYVLLGDIIKVTSGHENTHGTINEFYLMEGDSLIIDMNLRYDYKTISKKNTYYYNSQIRNIKYPQIDSNDKSLKLELEKVLNIAFNSKEIKGYYHFDKLKNKQLVIANYGFLKASIKIKEVDVVFKPKTEIQDKLFIEFEDINLNPNKIYLEIKINGKDVKIWFTFYKKNGKWKYKKPSIFEK